MLVANRETAAQWSDRDGDLRTQPEGLFVRAAQQGRQVRSAVVGDLPQRIPGETDVDEAEQGLAQAALNLKRRATGDVDVLLALVQLVARQRGEVPRPGLIEIDRAPERELVVDWPRPTPPRPPGSKSAVGA